MSISCAFDRAFEQASSNSPNNGDLQAVRERTLRRLAHLQYGDRQAVLLFTQDPTGVGGQIARRLLGLKLALLLDRKVIFPFVTEPPYGQVFEPIHSQANYAELLKNAQDISKTGDWSTPIVRLDFWDLWQTPKVRQRVYSYVPSEFSNIANAELYCDGLLLSFCSLTDQLKTFVAHESGRLGVGNDTLGVHIRRGDKQVETPFVPIDVINEQIERACIEGKFRKVFACSDDPEIFRQLRAPAGTEIVHDAEEKRYNNANHKLVMKNSHLAAQETKTAVKNIYLLGACGGIVGQSNAQFARLAAAQIALRSQGLFSGTLIDANSGLTKSRWARISHAAKKSLRSIARTVLPGLTLRAVKGRLNP